MERYTHHPHAEPSPANAGKLLRCPKCSSTQLTAQKQGFGLGKAVIGGVLTGGVGLLAGFVGSGKIKVTCLQCGHSWKPGASPSEAAPAAAPWSSHSRKPDTSPREAAPPVAPLARHKHKAAAHRFRGSYVAFFVSAAEVLGLLFILASIRIFGDEAVFWLSVSLLVVAFLVLITGLPAPRIHSRGKALAVALVAGLTLVASVASSQQEERLVALRETDVDAYLTELSRMSEARWLSALQELRPNAYSEEMAKRAAKAEAEAVAREAEAEARRAAEVEAGELFWVTSARLNRRTCPSESCGIVGQFFFREGVTIHERRDGWARVTLPYNASCVGGRSEYVDAGNANCDPANGITNGQFAEWVSATYLSENRPPDPAADASGFEVLVAGSDDFARYRTAFAEAAQSLIAQRRCTERDFRDNGGWMKSITHRNQPIYFTYCGGSTIANRLYLNADTGEVFR